MTEPQIRDQIAAIEAHKSELARMAGELAEAALWIEGGSVLDRERAQTRVERIAGEIAQALPALERRFPRDASEETDRIVITHNVEPCTRCAGTGEVPVVVEVRE